MMEVIASLANDEKLAADAYARIAQATAALQPEQLIQVNLDLQEATSTILGVMPEVLALRERIAKELPAFDISHVDKLEDYALALRFAHAAYQTATLPPDALAELSDEATRLRTRLLADATALSLHELIDPRKLESMKGAAGVGNIAQDLQMLSQILQENWAKIQGKSATSAEDLQAASRIATRLTRIIGVREQSPAQQAAVIEQRQRVWTLTIRAYDEVRAAIAFVRRREGDAESITPNLYTGKGRVRSSAKTDQKSTDPKATDPKSTTPSVDSIQVLPAVTPAAVAAATAAQKGGPGSKDPFLT